ncbi:MAG: protoporphyrinogen oxidase [Chlamydiales bacterium]|nr:protoporphyrinogen oxidase [Chlamydiales bacterium]
MKQKVLILGAGISGLSLAWYLTRSSLPLEVTILEKTARPGGWLHTENNTGYLFEKGPRTFKVDKSLSTIQLLSELGLSQEIIWSCEKPHHRYVWLRDRLVKFPTDPFSFLFSPLTKGFLRALATEWKKPAYCRDETVWNFISRRFNEDIARLCFDPMVVGIFGGDSRYISVRSCFPTLKRWEEEYGSVTKGFYKTFQQKRKEPKHCPLISGLPPSAIYSLKGGMEQIPQTLINQLPVEIQYESEVTAIRHLGSHVEVTAGDKIYKADFLFSALPVAQIGFLLKPLVPHLAEQLSCVKSCSITVINAGYRKKVLPVEGFGYLTSTFSKEEILGVVFDSSVFPQHNATPTETRLTIKLEDRGLSKDAMIDAALQGIRRHLGITCKPDSLSYKLAVHAIPQYGVGHLDQMLQLEQELLTQFPRLRLTGNYLTGVSVDQCIAKSREVAQKHLQTL